MPVYKIRGVDVDFPFEAYDCQIAYMEKVIQSLQEGCNALLESPTGTGKTLCLLCATLAWRKTLGEFSTNAYYGSQPFDSQSSQEHQHPGHAHPVIIYASRTHSQLKQVIRELKRTNFRPKMAILGSRQQMCIHDEVQHLQGRMQNNACQYLCKRRSCPHHARVSDYMKKHPDLGKEPFDIEDLVNMGRSQGPCPYYISRELHKVVDILFTPYNYLIEPGNRNSLSSIRWSNSVIIFDEAHNLESICSDASSIDLSCIYLSTCISEAKECVSICSGKREVQQVHEKKFDPDNYEHLKALLMALKQKISEIQLGSELGLTRPGNYMHEFLEELNITHETANILIDTIDDAVLLFQEDYIGNNQKSQSGGVQCKLEYLKDILNTIFKDKSKRHAKFYRFHVQDSPVNANDALKGESTRTLSWWCFNPGIAMEEFIRLGVRSIILTSGTLSPMESFALELNLNFPVRLENPHCISPSQVWVGAVSTGPSGYSLNSSYRNRDSWEYKQDLGNAMVNIARIVPDGVLVFFPSYNFMDQCIMFWKNMTHVAVTNSISIWERICRYKKPVVEPKQSALFTQAIEDYQSNLCDHSASGAIFFAVCRGKVSEGLDFADQAGRAVVVIGVPFSVKTAPKVRLKCEYLDELALSVKKDCKALTGEEWYVQQAARAVNQAVGRVIRHRHDYGAILLLDERFAYKSHQNQMSFWLRPYMKTYSKFGGVVFTLTQFFREKGIFSGNQSVEESRKLNNGQSRETLLTPNSPRFPRFSSIDPCSQPNEMEKITPANRSTLSNEHPQLPFGRLKDQVSVPTRQEDSVADNNVIDLTSDILIQPRITDTLLSSSLNESKVLSEQESFEYGNEILRRLFRRTSSDLETSYNKKLKCSLDVVEESRRRELDKKKASTSYCLKSSNVCGSAKEKSSTDQIHSKGGDVDHNCSLSSKDQKAKGSAFLIQVRENLSEVEYKEFVDLMKALKSKTMKTISIFESIANLFSSPPRLFLLEQFKNFIPVKYRPFYEKFLIDHP